MFLFLKVLLCVTLVDQINCRPTSDDGEEFTLDEGNHLLPSIESRFAFEDEFERIKKGAEHGKFFQGDIKLDKSQSEYLLSNESFPTRTGWIDEDYRWPKDDEGNVNVAYEISAKSRFNKNELETIELAMRTLEKYTCVRFNERSYEDDYVLVTSDEGCWSHLGKIGGEQELSLQKGGCFSTGTIMHEFIHALGYDHMHSSADRDKFITIKYENVDKESISNFDRVDPKKFSNFGTKYDLYSVMHYDKKAFSKNGKDTIVPKDRRYRKIIGQRQGLSYDDAQRIKNMYKCS